MLAKYVYSLINTGSNNKIVPKQILNGSKTEQIAFIEGCTLDGYVAKNNKKKLSYLVLYDGYSKDIRDNIYAMCKGLGLYVSKGYRLIKTKNHYSYSVRLIYGDIINPLDKHKRVELLNKRWYKMIKMTPEYINQIKPFIGIVKDNEVRYNRIRKLKNNIAVRENALVNESIKYDDSNYYLRIKSIEYSENNIFDIEVEDTHSYLISGIVSHNTINIPNNATVEDVESIYSMCYEYDIKGITIYRDGSRDFQPLSITNNAVDNNKTKDIVIEKDNVLIKNRPQFMSGITTKSDSPFGSIYLTANF